VIQGNTWCLPRRTSAPSRSPVPIATTLCLLSLATARLRHDNARAWNSRLRRSEHGISIERTTANNPAT
jgi:hypothetical protein